MRQILFVDDEPQTDKIESIKSYMDYYVLELRESKLYEVTVAKGPDEALKCLKQGEYSLAILDSMMPEGTILPAMGQDTGHGIWTGLSLARVIRGSHPKLPIFLLSSLASNKRFAIEKLLQEKGVDQVVFKLDNLPLDLLRKVNEYLSVTTGANP